MWSYKIFFFISLVIFSCSKTENKNTVPNIVFILADVEIPNDRIIDGNNLSHVFKSLSKSPTENFFYYWGAELMAVRYKSYKLHLKLHEAYDGKPMKVLKTPFLYNLDTDPSEKNNIYEDNLDVLDKIDEIIKKHKNDLIIAKDLLIDLK